MAWRHQHHKELWERLSSRDPYEGDSSRARHPAGNEPWERLSSREIEAESLSHRTARTRG